MAEIKKDIAAISLFSGGLDSILASRVIMAQGVRVQAVKFVTPFFDYHLLENEKKYARQIKEKFGIDVILRDVSEKYFTMLRNPAHGYGKNFNPCIDCKILLMSEACRMLPEFAASFLITGEVVGQRPMSQRRDTLRVIERDSGCEDLLLRPLSAKLLSPTKAERDGLVDRENLYDFSGRGRNSQIELASTFGITDYPAPAGGCSLTDPNRGKRFEWFHREFAEMTVADARLLLFGRHFHLPSGAWFVLGRDEKDNEKLIKIAQPGDAIIRTKEWPGPTGILRFCQKAEDIVIAAGLVKRFSKKGPGRDSAVITRRDIVAATDSGKETDIDLEQNIPVLADEIFSPWCR